MTSGVLDQLIAEYDDYFSVEHAININVTLPDNLTGLPDEETFLTLIPAPFLLNNEVSTLNHSALRSLYQLDNLAEELTSYLQQQAKKIDLMMNYILRHHDDPACRFQTFSFGGSGCSYLSATPLEPLQVVELKLFLENNQGSIFCYSQVLSCEKTEQLYQIKLVYKCIREEDRELIIRASLQQQSRQLKRKALERQQQS